MRFSPGCCCEYQCGMTYGLQTLGPTTDMEDYFRQFSSEIRDSRDWVWQCLVKADINSEVIYFSNLSLVERSDRAGNDGPIVGYPSGVTDAYFITSPGNDTFVLGWNQNCVLDTFWIHHYQASARPWTSWHLTHAFSETETVTDTIYQPVAHTIRRDYTLMWFDIDPVWEAVDPRNLHWYRYDNYLCPSSPRPSNRWLLEVPDFNAQASLFCYGFFGLDMKTPLYNYNGEFIGYNDDAKLPYINKILSKIEDAGILEGRTQSEVFGSAAGRPKIMFGFYGSPPNTFYYAQQDITGWGQPFGEAILNNVPETINTSLLSGVYFIDGEHTVKLRLNVVALSEYANDITSALDGSDIDVSDLYEIDIKDGLNGRVSTPPSRTLGLAFHYYAVEMAHAGWSSNL